MAEAFITRRGGGGGVKFASGTINVTSDLSDTWKSVTVSGLGFAPVAVFYKIISANTSQKDYVTVGYQARYNDRYTSLIGYNSKHSEHLASPEINKGSLRDDGFTGRMFQMGLISNWVMTWYAIG